MIACWILFNLSSPACLRFLCDCVWSAPPYYGSPDLCWRDFPPNPRNTCLDLRIITGESEKYTVMLEQLKPFIALNVFFKPFVHCSWFGKYLLLSTENAA
ncbi:hypothetical protein XENOCAPTIV_006398 [Xenoophorus captivus]|uniref:Secreted protein n=1 Tax=Xenoophorus captivus TaxID=1517983 RepID=A0ABV0Q3L8_9TELE